MKYGKIEIIPFYGRDGFDELRISVETDTKLYTALEVITRDFLVSEFDYVISRLARHLKHEIESGRVNAEN